MRKVAVVLVALLAGCMPSVYTLDVTEPVIMCFELKDGSQVQGVVTTADASILTLERWSIPGSDRPTMMGTYGLPRASVVRVFDSSGKDVTESYLGTSASVKYLRHIADVQTRVYNLTLAMLLVSVLSGIAALNAVK